MGGFKKYLNDEKPREKILKGPTTQLSDTELLCLLLGVGGKDEDIVDLARKLLGEFKSLAGVLHGDTKKLMRIKNVGLAKTSTIKAALEISRRLKIHPSPTPIIKSPKDIFDICSDIGFQSSEHVYLVSLNSRRHLLSKDLIYIGTANETFVNPREILIRALENNASSIILVHNHPSNDPTPSAEDVTATCKVATAASLVGIDLLDHIIVGGTDYMSMKSLGHIK
jgi:DNA repair protein RadC